LNLWAGKEGSSEMEKATKRIGEILRILHKEYPHSRTALEFKTPLEILVATILSAQCTDERVNKVTPALFQKYRTAADFAKAGGEVPEAMDKLISLPGVARKTANIVLSSAFGKAEGIAVDVHVKRLSGRLGLSRELDPDKIERDLMALLPQKEWLDFNYMMVNHGRKVCQARKPRCPECPLRRLCPSAKEFFPGLK